MSVLPSDSEETRLELGLIRRAQGGEAEAFSELCQLHGTRLLAHANYLSGDSTLAEDLMQEALVQAWKSIARYNGGCRFFTWLCSILVHRYGDFRRRKWPIPFSFLFGASREESEVFLSSLTDSSPAPGAELERTEEANALLRTLNNLPRKQREVVYLRFYAEDSLEGIAAALGCSVGTVKSRLYHGLERLRNMKSLAKVKFL